MQIFLARVLSLSGSTAPANHDGLDAGVAIRLLAPQTFFAAAEIFFRRLANVRFSSSVRIASSSRVRVA